ncbi:Fc.00g002680.m01.CDS01 [Cosmosporella sp. VM-42]
MTVFQLPEPQTSSHPEDRETRDLGQILGPGQDTPNSQDCDTSHEAEVAPGTSTESVEVDNTTINPTVDAAANEAKPLSDISTPDTPYTLEESKSDTEIDHATSNPTTESTDNPRSRSVTEDKPDTSHPLEESKEETAADNAVINPTTESSSDNPEPLCHSPFSFEQSVDDVELGEGHSKPPASDSNTEVAQARQAQDAVDLTTKPKRPRTMEEAQADPSWMDITPAPPLKTEDAWEPDDEATTSAPPLETEQPLDLDDQVTTPALSRPGNSDSDGHPIPSNSQNALRALRAPNELLRQPVAKENERPYARNPTMRMPCRESSPEINPPPLGMGENDLEMTNLAQTGGDGHRDNEDSTGRNTDQPGSDGHRDIIDSPGRITSNTTLNEDPPDRDSVDNETLNESVNDEPVSHEPRPATQDIGYFNCCPLSCSSLKASRTSSAIAPPGPCLQLCANPDWNFTNPDSTLYASPTAMFHV